MRNWQSGCKPQRYPVAAGFDRYREIAGDFAAFMAAAATPLPRFAWVNRLRIDTDSLVDHLRADGFAPGTLVWSTDALRIEGRFDGLGRHWTYLAGLFQVQEASMMVPALLLNPQPGDRILDLCAAPGNKTAQLALAMRNRGTVVANDLQWTRLKPLRATVNRLGLLNITITNRDGISYPRDAGLFDAVLVDAPCSCEGTSRKNPGVLKRKAVPDAGLQNHQTLLLKQAVRRCRPAGRIVYSTCTYAPEENEAVVDAVMREWPGELRVLPAAVHGFETAHGITRWGGRRYHPDLRQALRIWPHLNDTAGGFAVLLERTGQIAALQPAVETTKVETVFPTTGVFRSEIELRQLVAQVFDHFGIADSCCEGVRFFSRNKRQVFGVCADHQPPSIPGNSTGLPVLHVSRSTRKLTTAAAMAFGAAAKRCRVEMCAEQTRRYLSREAIDLSTEQRQAVNSGGFVLVQRRGFPLGLGVHRKDSASVESCYPKKLSTL